MAARKFTAFILFILLQVSVTHAQYIWKVTYDATWKVPPAKGNFIPQVTSFGNSCTALDVVQDSANSFSYRILTSTDAAHTWNIHNPHIPWSLYLNHIQQIDQRNTIIFGNSAILYLRTYDGGTTWDTLSIGHLGGINSIYFSDSAHAIATVRGFYPYFITTDGGRSWDSTDNKREDLIYPILDSNVEDRDYYGFDNGLQYGKDTFVSAGSFLYEDKGYHNYHPAFTASVDSGKHWSKPTVYENISGYPTIITPVTFDSVFCTGAFGHLLSSADHGVHWDGDDSIQFDTKYGFANCQTISWTNDGLIGAFWVFNSLGSHHVLARRERQSAEVEKIKQTNPEIKISPNPAATETIILTDIPEATITIFDMLGKKITTIKADPNGKAQLNTQSLQNGTYALFINGETSKKSLLVMHN
jgi:photosystem II stability/assembly factor-like uncharacterized protein